MKYIQGLRFIETLDALKIVDGEFNFPKSKNRSDRLYKKLIKKHISQEKKEPCIICTGDDVFCVHPSIMPSLKKELEKNIKG